MVHHKRLSLSLSVSLICNKGKVESYSESVYHKLLFHIIVLENLILSSNWFVINVSRNAGKLIHSVESVHYKLLSIM